MGFRFRKSIKVAPELKINFNKNSVGATLGTKGAHYTINSSGKRTSSVGIPGTGISYTESSGPTSKTTTKQKSTKSNSNESNSKGLGKGCLTGTLIFLLIGLLLALYTFAWIPALGVIIYTAVSKKYDKKKKIKKIAIAAVILITSLIAASAVPEESELTTLEISLDKTEFDINDSAEVILTLSPVDSQLDTLEISDNDIVTLDFADSKAVISFVGEGTTEFYFIANDSVESNTLEITVIDNSVDESITTDEADQTESTDTTTQDESNSNSSDESTQNVTEDTQNTTEDNSSTDSSEATTVIVPVVPDNSSDSNVTVPDNLDGTSSDTSSESTSGDSTIEEPTTYSYVLNTNTKKFHYSSCSSVSTIKPENYGTFEGTRDEVIAQGYEPCGHCHP